MLVEERVGSEIRSNDLETGLSSSDNCVEVEVETATSMPSSSQPSSSKTSKSKLEILMLLGKNVP